MNKLISVVQYNKYADRGIKNTFAKLITGDRAMLTRVRFNGNSFPNSFSTTRGFTNLRESNKFSIQVTYE